MRYSALFLAAFLSLPLCTAHAEAPQFHQVARVALPGDDRWDYLTVDPEAHRLYITRSTHITVMDTVDNHVIGDIPNIKGAHGVALVPELHKVFISSGLDNTVVVVDLDDRHEIARIAVGKKPDAILFEPTTSRVFAFNGDDGTATAIDAASNAVVKTIKIGGKLEFAATDDKGIVYDNVEDRNEMVAIDAKTMTVLHRWPLSGCEAPSGLAIDKATQRLFTACDNQRIAILDAETGHVLATPEIGSGPDAAVFDEVDKLAMTSNGKDGTISLIQQVGPYKYLTLPPIKTEISARTMAFDSATRRLYLIAAKLGATPPSTPESPHPRPSIEDGSVVLLVYEPQ